MSAANFSTGSTARNFRSVDYVAQNCASNPQSIARIAVFAAKHFRVFRNGFKSVCGFFKRRSEAYWSRKE